MRTKEHTCTLSLWAISYGCCVAHMALLYTFFYTALSMLCFAGAAIGIISNMIKRIIFYQTYRAFVARARTYSTLSPSHTFYLTPHRFSVPPTHTLSLSLYFTRVPPIYALLSHMCEKKALATTWFIHVVMTRHEADGNAADQK